MDFDLLKREELTPLSDSDIKKILGENTKILEYKDLLNYNDINKILTKDKDYLILLYELKASSGHWTAILKYDNMFEHFDPYGIKPDGELKWISAAARSKLHEEYPYLAKLLNDSDMDVIYNHTRFQSYKPIISTCGHHCVHRIYRFIHDNLDLDEYIKYMNYLKNEFKLNYDEVVAEFILTIN